MTEAELLVLRSGLEAATKAKHFWEFKNDGLHFSKADDVKLYDQVSRVWDVDNKCWLKTSKGHSYWAGKSTAKGVATYYQNQYSAYNNGDTTPKYIPHSFILISTGEC